MNFVNNLINFFVSKESRFNNLKAKKIMIEKNNFDKNNLTLGNTFMVNENILIKNFKEKIIDDNLTIVVTNNKGKAVGYITSKQLFKL